MRNLLITLIAAALASITARAQDRNTGGRDFSPGNRSNGNTTGGSTRNTSSGNGNNAGPRGERTGNTREKAQAEAKQQLDHEMQLHHDEPNRAAEIKKAKEKVDKATTDTEVRRIMYEYSGGGHESGGQTGDKSAPRENPKSGGGIHN